MQSVGVAVAGALIWRFGADDPRWCGRAAATAAAAGVLLLLLLLLLPLLPPPPPHAARQGSRNN